MPDSNRRRISIKDIAAAAGVSHPTVSRALRGEGRIGQETRQRILALADALGYTPSLLARGLVTQQTRTVGLVMTNLADPFHAEVARGVEDEAARCGFSVYVASSQVDAAGELDVVRRFRGRQVDGIIVSSSWVGDRYADLLQELGIPIVIINNQASGDNMYVVEHDDYAGARVLAQQLVKRGCRRIAYLGSGAAGRANRERWRAWQAVLQEAGLPACLAVTSPTGTLDGGMAGAAALLAASARAWGAPPDGMMCYNDMVAIGALRCLRQQGLRVPADVAVCGFDDIEFSEYVSPSLTTWHQPRFDLGQQAMGMLAALLDGAIAGIHRVITLRGWLVIRESTGV